MREHVVEFLSVYGGEYRSARASAGFAVVIEAVGVADAVGPAVVRRIGAFETFDGLHGGFGGGDCDAGGDEARFFNLDGQLRLSYEFVHGEPQLWIVNFQHLWMRCALKSSGMERSVTSTTEKFLPPMVAGKSSRSKDSFRLFVEK